MILTLNYVQINFKIYNFQRYSQLIYPNKDNGSKMNTDEYKKN